jgi:hypothetical protein
MKRYIGFLLLGVVLSPFTILVTGYFSSLLYYQHLPQGIAFFRDVGSLFFQDIASGAIFREREGWLGWLIMFAPANLIVLPVAALFVRGGGVSMLFLILAGAIEGYVGVYYLRQLFGFPAHPVLLQSETIAAACGGAFSGAMFGIASWFLEAFRS